MSPLVSIVIPCYNAEKYVGDAIRSALAQTYPHTEIIVIDDGSTDSSAEVIGTFGDSVRYVLIENSGAAAARNKGVDVSRGQLIQFLDADDVFYPEKLARQVPVAMTYADQLVFCDADVVDMQTNEKLGRWGRSSIGTDDSVVYLLNSILQTAAPLHWKAQFQVVGGFRPEMPPCDDPDLHLRLACAGVGFHHLSEPLYVARRVANSLSKRDHSHGLTLQKQFVLEAYEQLHTLGDLTDIRSAAFAGNLVATARQALRYSLYELSTECFHIAAMMHPDAGIPQAYSGRSRALYKTIGPRLTERVVVWGRRLLRIREIG